MIKLLPNGKWRVYWTDINQSSDHKQLTSSGGKSGLSTEDIVALDKDDIYFGDPDNLQQFTSNDNNLKSGNIELTIGIQENAASVSPITKSTNFSSACASRMRPASPNEILNHNQRARRIIEEVAKQNAGLKTTGLDSDEDITFIDDICIRAVSAFEEEEVGAKENGNGAIEDGDIIMASDGANDDSAANDTNEDGTAAVIDGANKDSTVTGVDGVNEENTFVTANEDSTDVTVNEDKTDDGTDEDGGNSLVEPNLVDPNWIIEDIRDEDKHG